MSSKSTAGAAGTPGGADPTPVPLTWLDVRSMVRARQSAAARFPCKKIHKRVGFQAVDHKGGSMGQYAGIGLQFAISILVFLYAGQWLDRRLGTSPWCLMLGVFVGAGAAFYSMYRSLMANQRKDDNSKRDNNKADK